MARSKITTIGRAKLAVATPEDPLHITHIAVSDGPAAPVTASMTALPGTERWRGASSAPIKDAAKPGWLAFESVIPGNHGGYTIRYIGLFDADGDLIAITQTGDIQKPAPESTDALTLTLRPSIILDDAAQIELIYSDQGAIDHQGLTNRSAPDSHPISAISGLADALNHEIIAASTHITLKPQHLKSKRLMVLATAASAATVVRLPSFAESGGVDITIRRMTASPWPIVIHSLDGELWIDDIAIDEFELRSPGESVTLRADPTRERWYCLARSQTPRGPVTTTAASLTLSPEHEGLLVVDASAASRTITLPSAANEARGREYMVWRADAATGTTLTVAAAGSDKIVFDATAGVASATLTFAGDYLRLRADPTGGKWWVTGRAAQLNNTLTSTSTTAALTAAQGKALQDSKLNIGAGGFVGGAPTAENANSILIGIRAFITTTEGESAAKNLPGLGGAASDPRGWIIECLGLPNRTVQLATQVYVGPNQNRTFVRAKHDDTWGAWSELARERQASETVGGTLKIATQVQTDAGAVDDVAISPKKLRWGLSASLTPNGYIALPSWLLGVIIQWGNGTVAPSAGGTVVTYPIAFPNAALTKPILSARNSTNEQEAVQYIDESVSGFRATTSTSGTFGFGYLVIGH